MQISIDTRDNESAEQWREYLSERLEKIRRYFDGVLDVHVVLESERYLHKVEITVQVEGVVLHGQEASEDWRKAIDAVTEKMERQLCRHSEKLRRHRRRAPVSDMTNLALTVNTLPAEEVEGKESAAESSREPLVVRTNRMMVKPMSVEEAAMQMDLMDQNFMVFRHDRTERVNVLYRRRDGQYGLIDPE